MNEDTPLWRALGICPGDMVAFTGTSDKRALALTVVRELCEANRPVLLTSSTGLNHDQAAALRQALPGCVILTETEENAGHPLTASVVPTIPAGTDLMVPVIGAAIPRLAAPVGSRIVPILCPSAPTETQEELRERARLLLTTDPLTETAGARTATTDPQTEAEQAVDLPARPVIGRVVLADPETSRPVRAVLSNVAVIVLAGGASRRFGGAKLLHRIGDRTLLEHSLLAPLRAGIGEVVVVTGAYHEQLAPLLVAYPVRTVPNPHWNEGMSTTLKAGMAALEQQDDHPGAVIVCLGDQPKLPPQVVRDLAGAWQRSRAPVVAPAVQGQRHNPVLFDWSLTPLFQTIAGDEGARAVVQQFHDRMQVLNYREPSWFADVDTAADVRRTTEPDPG